MDLTIQSTVYLTIINNITDNSSMKLERDVSRLIMQEQNPLLHL